MTTTSILRFLVLLLAILQPLVAYVSGIGESSVLMETARDPIITPARYAFSIWSVITIGSLCYALYQVLPGRRNEDLYDRIAPYAAGTFLGFSAWLVAAEQEWLGATVLIFIAMGLCLYTVLRSVVEASRAGVLSVTEQVAVHGTFGLYTGWASVAIFANIASALVFEGYASGQELLWQLILLSAATAAVLYLIRIFRGSLPYMAAILWAYVAIVFGTLETGEYSVLTYAAVLSTLLILATSVLVRRQPSTTTVATAYALLYGLLAASTIGLSVWASVSPSESVRAARVEYAPGMSGYYAAPHTEGAYPGIIMIHENRGLRPEIEAEARALAREGYRVLAVDLYEGNVFETQEEARAYAPQFNQEAAIALMQEGVAYLRAQGSPTVASLGWCFGGRQALELALSGIPLDATVIYYGSGIATSTDALAPITWPVLGIFGAEDRLIPRSTVESFENSLKELGVTHEIYVYEGVGHAFANPSNPDFAPEPTADAWAKTLAFLDAHLR